MNKIKQIKRKSDQKRGFSTLENINSNCYMNSVLQCLSNTQFAALIRALDTGVPDSESENSVESEDSESENSSVQKVSKDTVVYCLSLLFRVMNRRRQVCITAMSFHRVFTEKFNAFAANEQQDASEFLFCLLDEIDSSLQKRRVSIEPNTHASRHYIDSTKEWTAFFKNKRSIVSQKFYGQYLKKFTCTNCGNVFYKYDPFMYLSIPCTNSNASVYDLIMTSTILDVVKLECGECKSEYDPEYLVNKPHEVETFIYKLPEILVITVDLFKMANGVCGKNNSNVQLSKTLDLYKKVFTNTDESVCYNLNSIVYHSGKSIDSGHYYSVLVKNEKYHIFDDSNLTVDVDPTSIKDIPCILFYSRMKNK